MRARQRVEWRMPCPVAAVVREGGRVPRVDRRTARSGAASLVIATGGSDGAEDRRDAFRLSDRRAIRVARGAAAARRWCRWRSSPARSRAMAISRACRSTPRCRATADRFRENLLFTHRGLSGPAILQVSSYWNGGEPIHRSICCRASTRARGSPRERASRRAASPTLLRSGCRSDSRSSGAQRTSVRRSRSGSWAKRGSRDIAARLHALARAALRHARLQQGRGHAGRRRYARAVVEDDGGNERCRACISSARSSTSPAGSAATISSGRGRRATPPGNSRDGRTRRLRRPSRRPCAGLASTRVNPHPKRGVRMSARLPFSPSRMRASHHRAPAQVRVGLMVSATGPDDSAIGIPQKNTGELLPTEDRRRHGRIHPAGRRRRHDARRAERQETDAGEQHRRADRPVDHAERAGDPRRDRRSQGADDGDGRHVVGGRADGCEEALGIQDDAERRPDRRAR